MSIELNWDTLTSGPDGEELAMRIRDFIHTKFQAVPLPRFIKSVKVHDFQFGSIPPRVTLKDICDPLPDFYEEMPEADELDDEAGGDESGGITGARNSTTAVLHDEVPDAIRAAERRRREEQRRRLGGTVPNSRSSSPAPDHLAGFPPHIHTAGLRSAPQTPDLSNPFLGLTVSTPGIPGGTANMHYFPSHIATGWSGTQTPLAAVAGAQHLNGWLESGGSSSYPQSPSSQGRGGGGGNGGHHRNHSQSSISIQDFPVGSPPSSLQAPLLREKHSVSTLAPTSAGASRPPTRDTGALAASAIDEEHTGPSVGANANGDNNNNDDDDDDDAAANGEYDDDVKFRERRIEDLQAVFRIKYSGDIKLMLTAEILLDYPMPSFVGIPVKLNITGLSFDGVGVVANIRKRVHFCFLSPEDAVTAIGNDADSEDEENQPGMDQGGKRQKGRMGGLLQEIKVESEIGQREGIKQSLKNVGKVERFVLEQVRRIFEEEFVYPSFWTFLV